MLHDTVAALTAERALVESSHLEEMMREPVANWRFDPAEAQWYDVVLHDLLDAARHEHADVTPQVDSTRPSQRRLST